jgi:hypothetical protein
MEKAGKVGPIPIDAEAEKRLDDKDREFKLACQRYARMRARNIKP